VNVGNLNLLWAELFLDGFAAAGGREVVVSPGSRSAPLALAAARHADLDVRVVVDERAAGFFALGQARVTGRPTLAVCTSGSAGAHYFPAVIEADEADLPLLVVSADRPPELLDRQAAQTTRQAGFYDGHVRVALDLGAPDADARALAGVWRAGTMAFARSLDPRPGPVHVNAPFRKPLEPTAEDGDDRTLRDEGRHLRRGGERFLPPVRVANPTAVAALAARCSAARRGVIVCGPGPLSQRDAVAALAALAGRLGFPVLAEAASQFRFADTVPPGLVGQLELLCPGEGLVAGDPPDFVLQVGRPLTSTAWGRWLEGGEAPPRWIVAAHGWNDPSNNAAGVVLGDLGTTLANLAGALGEGAGAATGWGERWREAEVAATRAVAEQLGEESARGELSESAVARGVVSTLPARGMLAVANSLAVREVDLACPPGLARVAVLAARGVAGIDGSVAGAAGAASAAGLPVTALLGDLALLHDLGSLATLRHAKAPVVIVVLANDGGRLFELLPLAGGAVDEATVRELFVAPQGVRFAGAAEMFGLAYHRVESASALATALEAAHAAVGHTLIEAHIHGRPLRERRRELWERARGLLAGSGG